MVRIDKIIKSIQTRLDEDKLNYYKNKYFAIEMEI